MLKFPRHRIYALALLFAIASAIALTVDMPVARNTRQHWPLGDLRKLLDVSEVFAHGLGVLMILTTVAVLDPSSRRRLPRVGTCVFGAGVMAQLGKHLVPRIRPNECNMAADVWQTFFAGGGADFARTNSLAGRAIQSFPSGHAATAVALAFGLAWLYPRGRWLFACFAVLAAAQRIQSMSHFVSDTFAGAAIASLVAGVCWDERLAARVFPRCESSTQAAPAATCLSSAAADDASRQDPHPEVPRRAA